MEKIGLFFGSFNPVHVGHLIIASYMATQTDLDQVWLVVSPQNPLKSKRTLANDYDRLHLVEVATQDDNHIKASNIEFKLPKPSYTVDTLTYLREQYPDKEFVLIMGGDNLMSLPKWKNYEVLLRDYRIYVYHRPDYPLGDLSEHPNVQVFSEVPLMQISASYIRKCLKEGKSVRYLVPDAVYQSLMDSHLYQ
jgi:nicotinate-nucleotide adenylyltransferase